MNLRSCVPMAQQIISIVILSHCVFTLYSVCWTDGGGASLSTYESDFFFFFISCRCILLVPFLFTPHRGAEYLNDNSRFVWNIMVSRIWAEIFFSMFFTFFFEKRDKFVGKKRRCSIFGKLYERVCFKLMGSGLGSDESEKVLWRNIVDFSVFH